MKTTLGKIKKFNLCSSGWIQLIKTLNSSDLNKEVSFEEILKSNGIKDAVWGFKSITL